MHYDLYNKIISQIQKCSSKDVLSLLEKSFTEVSRETLSSIVSLESAKKVKQTYHEYTTTAAIKKHYEIFLEKRNKDNIGFLAKYSDSIGAPPSLIARIVLEEYVKALPNVDNIKNEVTRLYKDTSLIDDPVLACEIFISILEDKEQGPCAAAAKNAVGSQYELKLMHALDAHGCAFIDETILRDRGYDKTPDIKLEIPILVDEKIVTWIESKASFGDLDNHQRYVREQYRCYVNRFGPGLVIYWFGFIEELQDSDENFIIMDRFPSNIIHMKQILNATVNR